MKKNYETFEEYLEDNPIMQIFNQEELREDFERKKRLSEATELEEGEFLEHKISVDMLNAKREGSVMFINSETGTGKTSFALTNVLGAARARNTKMLLLVPRTRIKNSIEEAIRKSDNNGSDDIVVQTYQKVVYDYEYNGKTISDQFGYVVCDEYHFFTNDSSFNYNTDVAFDLVMKTKATKLFISATPDKLYDKVKKRCNKNHTSCERMIFKRISPPTYQLYPYSTKKARNQRIEEIIEDGKKAFVFIDNKRELFDAYKKFKSVSTFIVAKGKKDDEYYKHVNEDEIKELVETKKIPKQLIFTTSVMIEGIDIEDDALDTIFIETTSIEKAVQAIGRDRLLKADIAIKHISKREIQWKTKQITSKLRFIERFYNNQIDNATMNRILTGPYAELLNVVRKDRVSKMDLEVNMMAHIRLESDLKSCYHIKNSGFPKAVLSKLSKKTQIRDPLEETLKTSQICNFCYNNVEEKFFEDDKDIIINLINQRREYSTKLVRSVGSLDKMIRFHTSNQYGLFSERELSRTSGLRGKVYWVIKAVDDYTNAKLEIKEKVKKEVEESKVEKEREKLDFNQEDLHSLLKLLNKSPLDEEGKEELIALVNKGIEKESRKYIKSISKVQERLDLCIPDRQFNLRQERKMNDGKRITYWVLIEKKKKK